MKSSDVKSSDFAIARSEFILGGQKSGKSRRAELIARAWLEKSADHKAVLLATGQAYDEEMRERIARHRHDRSVRVPGMLTVEEPLHLAEAISLHSQPDTLLVVDCLTLWLTNCLMPVASSQGNHAHADFTTQTARLAVAITTAPGPVVLVGNEIGLGVIPLGREVRVFVDTLGRLNQDVAELCVRVTLMAAGLPLTLKGTA
ncbi:bifunctional adenosylcobinamide kinase/adenosylcobinamide-phosphate guanylyltransferase [Noviherbaspirillum sedimenti]|uniref:Bifunctional adenosylcobalamin biosynthesis protein n=1 Tax=Noviherbaspirillum sedimenti TaxID=2320865 RepID=A0A3A3FVX5_9BURK|nr:bifunctional adenosylcobinamide kinase/adenosylcobinamide-phosphate guanylyltransferase [Noviherbaspirillum sedimenti]RJG00348.1 bifunctional adenosylcobinamide kinase/adenosylcobinamide-phosphate guanylyltransferase [Noviherbaspirillum sedimenti]